MNEKEARARGATAPLQATGKHADKRLPVIEENVYWHDQPGDADGIVEYIRQYGGRSCPFVYGVLLTYPARDGKPDRVFAFQNTLGAHLSLVGAMMQKREQEEQPAPDGIECIAEERWSAYQWSPVPPRMWYQRTHGKVVPEFFQRWAEEWVEDQHESGS